MTYTQALRLKKAGFPQYLENVPASGDKFYPVVDSGIHKVFDSSLLGYPESEPDFYDQGKWRPSTIFSRAFLSSQEGTRSTLYFPSSNELIKACGDSLEAMSKYSYEADKSDLHWRAYPIDEAFENSPGYQEFPCVVDCCGYTSGDTLEEALVDFYLKYKITNPN